MYFSTVEYCVADEVQRWQLVAIHCTIIALISFLFLFQRNEL